MTRVATGVDLAVRTSGSAADVLLVHGLASNARMWDGVATTLAERGRGSVAVDLRGHGESTGGGTAFDFDTLASDLAVVVARHMDPPVVAVGQSWGGNVVLELARRHPGLVRRVVCVDGGFIRLAGEFDNREAMKAALAPPSFEGLTIGDLRNGMAARFAGWPIGAIDGALGNFRIRADGTVQARLDRSDHFQILDHLWEHDPDAAVAALDVPVTVIAVPGALSRRERVETFMARHPEVDVIWAEGDHDIHAQQPELVAEVIDR